MFTFNAPASEGLGVWRDHDDAVVTKCHIKVLTVSEVDISVRRAFKVVQQMSLTGSLDPGCKAWGYWDI